MLCITYARVPFYTLPTDAYKTQTAPNFSPETRVRNTERTAVATQERAIHPHRQSACHTNIFGTHKSLAITTT